MDWSKAKTYLILTFLLLDLVLGYQYYTSQQEALGYVQSFDTQLDELKEVLHERKMMLVTDVPKETPVMNFIQVGHPKEPIQQIAERMLQEDRLIENDQSKGTMKFRSLEGEFEVTPDGFFRLRFEPGLMKADRDLGTKRGQYALQRIAPYVWHGAMYKEDVAVNNFAKGTTTLRYLQSYERYPIFSAVLEINLQDAEIISYNQKALEVGEQEERGQRVISAIGAIRTVAETQDPAEVADPSGITTIHDVKLGYYSQNYVGADVWYLAPMWRIVTDHKVFYVNALTGQLEDNGA
ncbi:regulatory protein YycI of two-component signal transduction system YycFG [Tumebacillus sp. BK434]|uniref:two-component system regulatory protein YycI n=1 Tax=Tumebacillus sp. BK434 TaxID=2512169 RepID=UPI001050F7B6|nr:two-component system regulatory protein YycI [Tumebacillus sp. BK434]TCP52549.1 regulatory protein YycI of two-component signal transduction system YycFG [Tumebacillus sp. BK434]